MAAGYTTRWHNEGPIWKRILDWFEAIATRLAASEENGGWGAEVTREHWDAPKLDLRWYSDDDIGRAVQVLIAGTPEHYELRVSGSAWKDFDHLGQRWWMARNAMAIPVPVDPEQFDLQKLEAALWSAREMVSKWKEDDLTERVRLPERDPSLSGTIVRGRYVAQGTELLHIPRHDVLNADENALARERLESYGELMAYWAKHGGLIQKQNPGKFLVLVALLGPQPEYYTDREKALARARELGFGAVFIPIPAKGGDDGPAILD